MRIKKSVAAGLGAIILASAVAPVASAQEIIPLPGFGQNVQQMPAFGQNVQQVPMKKNHPAKEKIKNKLDNLSFEQKKEKILSNLNEKLKMIEAVIQQVQAAQSEEELQNIKPN